MGQSKRKLAVVKPQKLKQAGKLSQGETDMLYQLEHVLNTAKAIVQVEETRLIMYGQDLMKRRGLDPEKHAINAEDHRWILVREVKEPQTKEQLLSGVKEKIAGLQKFAEQIEKGESADGVANDSASVRSTVQAERSDDAVSA
jgi:hypothetical protein